MRGGGKNLVINKNIIKKGKYEKFWGLSVHTYQKQSFLITILAVRGGGKNLVIDRNFIVKMKI